MGAATLAYMFLKEATILEQKSHALWQEVEPGPCLESCLPDAIIISRQWDLFPIRN